MILGFLGKGGAGKSTLATMMARYRASRGDRVLAVDADHNNDLSFYLSPLAPRPYGDALPELIERFGLDNKANYRDVFKRDLRGEKRLALDPLDPFLSKYSVVGVDGILVMSAGGHTEDVLADRSCSHSLFSPLKVILPNLDIGDNQFVVVDEKAGRDGAGTGTAVGFNLAVVVVEPKVPSIKAALQIDELLSFFRVPSVFVVNKFSSANEVGEVASKLGREVVGGIPMLSGDLVQRFAEFADVFDRITSAGREIIQSSGDLRFQRARERYFPQQSVV